MSRIMRGALAPVLLALFAGAAPATAVLFASTSDPAFNTSAPDGALQDSGWQYEGAWALDTKTGTPVAEQCFVTASHVGGSVGDPFVFAGHSYVTDRVDLDPNADLAIWHVTESFPRWAPLYRKADEVGKDLVVIGRGTQRGGDVMVLGTPARMVLGRRATECSAGAPTPSRRSSKVRR